MFNMPGKSFAGIIPESSRQQATLAGQLEADVNKLAGDIGERNLYKYPQLIAAAKYIESSFSAAGYNPKRQTYTVRGKEVYNIQVELTGQARPDRIIIIGAHYDSRRNSPGADDNASGVAALLALSKVMAGKKFANTIRFAAFVNEESPYFHTSKMGSLVYAKQSKRKKENIIAMFAFDGLGYYTENKNTQRYPAIIGLFYPSKGNFIGFASDLNSQGLLRQSVDSFRRNTNFPSQGGAATKLIPTVGWSDNWAFYEAGYPAVMITDMLPYRYPHYHKPTDTPDKLNYDHMARVVKGLQHVFTELAGPVKSAPGSTPGSTPGSPQPSPRKVDGSRGAEIDRVLLKTGQ